MRAPPAFRVLCFPTVERPPCDFKPTLGQELSLTHDEFLRNWEALASVTTAQLPTPAVETKAAVLSPMWPEWGGGPSQVRNITQFLVSGPEPRQQRVPTKDPRPGSAIVLFFTGVRPLAILTVSAVSM